MIRVQQTKGDLKVALKDQVALLVSDCRNFDNGMIVAAKSIDEVLLTLTRVRADLVLGYANP